MQGRSTEAWAVWVAWLNPYTEMQATATAGIMLHLRGICWQQQLTTTS